ncbi:hypothetical protein ES703_83749 [subsurface metagenome]
MFSIRGDGGRFLEEGVLSQFLEFFGFQVNLVDIVESLGECRKEQLVTIWVKAGRGGLVKGDVDFFNVFSC